MGNAITGYWSSKIEQSIDVGVPCFRGRKIDEPVDDLVRFSGTRKRPVGQGSRGMTPEPRRGLSEPSFSGVI
jgi:hypothetical protein